MPKVFTTLMEFIQLGTEGMVSLVLGLTLLITNPVMTLMLLFIAVGMTIIVIWVLKPTLNRLGRTSQKIQSQMGKWKLQSIYGIKDVKILNKENFFAGSFGKYSERNAKLTTNYTVLNNMPRLLIETFSICGILAYLAVCIVRSQDLTELMPQISAFAVAAMRLLPSANRINNYLTSISYFEPFFMGVSDNLQEEIHDDSVNYDAQAYLQKKEVEKLPVRERIELKDIVYHYPNSDVLIFDHAQMTIPVGSSVGVVGTSGAGKTTIIDILLGLLSIQEGQILADGVEVRDHYEEWLKNIGYIPQTIFMIDSSCFLQIEETLKDTEKRQSNENDEIDSRDKRAQDQDDNKDGHAPYCTAVSAYPREYDGKTLNRVDHSPHASHVQHRYLQRQGS